MSVAVTLLFVGTAREPSRWLAQWQAEWYWAEQEKEVRDPQQWRWSGENGEWGLYKRTRVFGVCDGRL